MPKCVSKSCQGTLTLFLSSGSLWWSLQTRRTRSEQPPHWTNLSHSGSGSRSLAQCLHRFRLDPMLRAEKFSNSAKPLTRHLSLSRSLPRNHITPHTTQTKMPPRIRSSQALLNCVESSSSNHSLLLSSSQTITSLRPSSHPQQCRHQQQTSAFSTTAARGLTVPQKMFRKWLKENPQFRNHKGSGPSYLGQRRPSQEDKETTKTIHPFPENPHFVSEPVLSEASRQSIWKAVMKRALPLKAVSARFNVDIRRVAAVVRMKQIEKQWEHEVRNIPPVCLAVCVCASMLSSP